MYRTAASHRLLSSRRLSAGGRAICRLLPFILSTILLTAAAAVSSAAGDTHHAGLVIRHGDGELTYAYVAFTEDEISGFQLLGRTGIDQVTIPFGSLGQGVCSLEGEGCASGECRRNVCQSNGSAPYWRYFRQVEPGTWQAAPLGASQAKVRDGTIDAWVWTADSAGLPSLSMDDIRELAGVQGTSDDAGGIPTPAVRSAHAAAEADGRATPRALAAGGLIILLVALAGLLAIFRSRRGGAR